MVRPKVLITSILIRPGDEVACHLQQAGLDIVFNYCTQGRTEDEMTAILKGVDGVIAGLDPFTCRALESGDRLKVIARTGVGYDAIDVEAATGRGIVVCITPGTNHRSVADFTLGLVLQCARKMLENLSAVPKGEWQRHQGVELYGRTLGIVGLGTVGKEVAKRAAGFDMKILAYDLYQDHEFASRYGVTYVPLEDLLSQADFVTLHLFLDHTTRHLINAERLALMKPTAYLINTARGGIVDQEALYQALKERKIAGAALDVFEQEPPAADEPLLALDNVYLSAHLAGITRDSGRAMGLMAAENVIRVLRGEKPLQIVNPAVLRTGLAGGPTGLPA